MGEDDDVPHLVKVRLRFVAAANDSLSWEALREEMPHCDVAKWLKGGGWGTFAGELRQGSLVSLLYLPDNPKRCRIVPGFRSHRHLTK